MRSYISYDELEELGETIVRAYINKTRRYNALCVDIEGLVTDYLGLTVVYETIVEDDLNKIAFLSNGNRPLRVVRDGKRVEVVFPKNTAVLDKVLLNERESSRRRFTLSAGHARAVLTLSSRHLQMTAAQKIIALRLSVRQAEAMCKRMAAEEKPKKVKPALTVDYVGECEKALTKQLGRKVRIVSGKRKGRFELEFYGQDDLQRLYEILLAIENPEEPNA